MKSIVVLGDTSSNVVIKGSKTFKLGLVLKESPSSNVTLSIASRDSKFTVSTASMTFTTSNWSTPQELTITPVNDGIADCIYVDQLQLSASGGGYSTTLNKTVSITDVTAAKEWIQKGYPVLREFTIANPSDAETKKQSMISFWFNGNGVPQGPPDLVTDNYTGSIHSAGNNTSFTYANLKRVRWTLKDEANYDHVFYGYFFTPVSPNGSGEPIIMNEGHGPDSAALVIQPFLDAGYYLMYMGMPVEGNNTTTNPSVLNSGSAVANHNSIKDIATSTYDPIHLFVEPQLRASKWLTDQGFATKTMLGFSGGGTSNLAAIFDPTITKIFYNRAFNWHTVAILDGAALSAFDYENFESVNSSTRFYNHMIDKQWGDLFMMVCLGRELYIMGHSQESAAQYARYTFFIPTKMSELAQAVGGTIAVIKDVNVSRASHAWYANDATVILALL